MSGKHAKKVHIGRILVPIIIAGTIIYVGTKSGEKYKEYDGRNEIVNETVADELPTNNVELIDSKEEHQEEKNEEKPEPKKEEKVEEPVVEKEIEKPTVTTIDGLEIEQRKVVKANTTINIRNKASMDSDIYTTLSTGNSLNLIYQEDEDWYKVDYQGQEAYVSTHYSTVLEQKQIKSPIQKIVYFKESSNLFSDNVETESIKEIPKLEAAPIYGETETHYVTSIDNQIGYIKKDSVKELTGTFAIVDISDQTAYLYKDNELVLSSPVVTGKNSTPTTKGLHEVWLMESNRYLTGADFKVHVDVVAFFHNGEGIHDASWRSAFGGEIYKNGGSHGCVNMPTEAAKTFYKNLEVGDKVLVKQ